MTVLEKFLELNEQGNYSTLFPLLKEYLPKMGNMEKPTFHRFLQEFKARKMDIDFEQRVSTFIQFLPFLKHEIFNEPTPIHSPSNQTTNMLDKYIYLEFKNKLPIFKKTLNKSFGMWDSIDDKLNHYKTLYGEILPYITAYNSWLSYNGSDIIIPTLTFSNPAQSVKKEEEIKTRKSGINNVLTAFANIDELVQEALLDEVQAEADNSGLKLFKEGFLYFLKSGNAKELYDCIEEVDSNIQTIYEEIGYLDRDLQDRFEDVWNKIMDLYNAPKKNQLTFKGDFYKAITTTTAISKVLNQVHRALFNTQEDIISISNNGNNNTFIIGKQKASVIHNIGSIDTLNL